MNKPGVKQAYMVLASAKIRLTGVARIIDIDGNIVEERDLSTLGEVETLVNAADRLNLLGGEECGITFSIPNVFAKEQAK